MYAAVVLLVTLATGLQAPELPLRVTGSSMVPNARRQVTQRFELAIGRWPTAAESMELADVLARHEQRSVAFYRALEDLPEVGRVLLGSGPSTPIYHASATRAAEGWRVVAVTHQTETLRDFRERQIGSDVHAMVLIEMELDDDGRGSGIAYVRAELDFDRREGEAILAGEYQWRARLMALRPPDEG